MTDRVYNWVERPSDGVIGVHSTEMVSMESERASPHDCLGICREMKRAEKES